MQNHLYRSILIIALLLIAIVNIVPTVGWSTLSDEEKEARTAMWGVQDFERAGSGANVFERYGQSIKRWSEFNVDWVITQGLDLQGGVHMVIGFDASDLTEEQIEAGITEESLQETILLNVRNRIEEFEAQEPSIQKLGKNQVQVMLPGEKDVQRAKDLIMQTAVLGFHIGAGPNLTDDILTDVDKHFNNGFVPFLKDRGYNSPFYGIPQNHIDRIREMVKEANAVEGLIPEDQKLALSPPPAAYDKEADYTLYVVTKEAGVSGEGITSAVARPNPEAPGQWMILFQFDSETGAEFGELTTEHKGEALAILLDGKVVSAPNINEKITTNGSISGSFGADEGKDLAIALNSGSMPVTIREDYTGIVGATIGGESATQGVNASIIGLVFVMLFMLAYYRLGGVIANIALAVNAALILGAFAYFNTTLTLPGIAGLILTIGMAVDANVLIFERIREEAKQGKSLKASIEGGYARASSAIWDANITTLIAAIVLTQFGTGPVQGFAVALSIGICASVFAALVVTRAILEFVAERKMVTVISMASIIKSEPKFSFLEKRKVAAIFSLTLIGIGVAIFASRGQGMYGVDFTNGTNIQVAIASESEIGVEAVRDTLNKDGFSSAIVQESSEGNADEINRFLIRIGVETATEETDATVDETEDDAASTVSEAVQLSLVALADSSDESLDTKVEILRSETVGPAVGEKLRRDAIWAIFFALLFIVMYLWFRFEWKYAVGAVVALMHDVLIVIGVLALMQREISIPVVAALLTIIGYSLNDTIVVFDRVREDIALNKSRGMNFMDMLNTSVNRTLSRTLLTSITTLFVVVILYIFGGAAINDFALALIAGVIIGTYSSIFVATPVVYTLQKGIDKREAATVADAGKKNSIAL